MQRGPGTQFRWRATGLACLRPEFNAQGRRRDAKKDRPALLQARPQEDAICESHQTSHLTLLYFRLFCLSKYQNHIGIAYNNPRIHAEQTNKLDMNSSSLNKQKQMCIIKFLSYHILFSKVSDLKEVLGEKNKYLLG